MVTFQLEIVDDGANIKIGPFHTDRWPRPDEILKIQLVDVNHGSEVLDGPPYIVTHCEEDERLVTVKRHVQ